MSETFMTLTECVPGYVHSHIIHNRTLAIGYAVCQRCHKTLSFSKDHIHRRVGWITCPFTIQEWP